MLTEANNWLRLPVIYSSCSLSTLRASMYDVMTVAEGAQCAAAERWQQTANIKLQKRRLRVLVQ